MVLPLPFFLVLPPSFLGRGGAGLALRDLPRWLYVGQYFSEVQYTLFLFFFALLRATFLFLSM